MGRARDRPPQSPKEVAVRPARNHTTHVQKQDSVFPPWLQEPLIALFVLWHGFAIGIYALPLDAHDAVSTWARKAFLPLVRPYILLTSQWQQWNLFAPDPLRRVTTYEVQRLEAGSWETLERIEPGTYPWWRHAAQFKVFERILEERSEHREPLRRNFLSQYCKEEGMGGSVLRLLYRIYVIPKHNQPPPSSFWYTWNPDIEEVSDVTTRCL